MSRICRPTAINSRKAGAPVPGIRLGRRHRQIAAWLWILLVCGLLGGCQSVRPIVKIGLIAPFEGLYRTSGYQALSGLRAGITDCSPAQVAVLPQALDDSADPQQAARAAAKLAVDPAVHAMIGPIFPPVQPHPDRAAPAGAPQWLLPYHIDPAGRFTAGANPAWLAEMGAYILQAAPDSPAVERVLVVGLPPDLLPSWQGNERVSRVDDPARALDALQRGDGILWFGLPHRAAPWLRAAWQEQPDLPFWLGAQSGADVLTAHLYARPVSSWTAAGQVSGSPPGRTAQYPPFGARLYWLYWTDSGYNQWLKLYAPTSPAAYHIYRATCASLASLDGSPSSHAQTSGWRLQQKPLRPDQE